MAKMPQQFDAEDAVAVMGGVAASLEYMQPALDDCIPIMQQAVRDNFNSSASPENSDWVERVHIGDGHPLLMDTGALLQAATGGGAGHVSRVSHDTAEVGVDLGVIPYARAHNQGRPEVNLPQREFLGMREERERECAEVVADYVVNEVF